MSHESRHADDEQFVSRCLVLPLDKETSSPPDNEGGTGARTGHRAPCRDGADDPVVVCLRGHCAYGWCVLSESGYAIE
jgi:hypothetical protein